MHGQPQILDSIFSLFLEGVAGKPGGGLQGAGGGVPERRLVFARDQDPQALNLQQPRHTSPPKKWIFSVSLRNTSKSVLFWRTCLEPTNKDKLKLEMDVHWP
jgi:hypothetical protein